MSSYLTPQELDLLTEVVGKNQPGLLELVEAIGLSKLTAEQVNELRSVITSELSQTGLNENDEPNQRGLLLEGLIDRLGHLIYGEPRH